MFVYGVKTPNGATTIPNPYIYPTTPTYNGLTRAYIKPTYSAHTGIPEPFRYRNHLFVPTNGALLTAKAIETAAVKTCTIVGVN